MSNQITRLKEAKETYTRLQKEIGNARRLIIEGIDLGKEYHYREYLKKYSNSDKREEKIAAIALIERFCLRHPDKTTESTSFMNLERMYTYSDPELKYLILLSYARATRSMEAAGYLDREDVVRKAETMYTGYLTPYTNWLIKSGAIQSFGFLGISSTIERLDGMMYGENGNDAIPNPPIVHAAAHSILMMGGKDSFLSVINRYSLAVRISELEVVGDVRQATYEALINIALSQRLGESEKAASYDTLSANGVIGDVSLIKEAQKQPVPLW